MNIGKFGRKTLCRRAQCWRCTQGSRDASQVNSVLTVLPQCFDSSWSDGFASSFVVGVTDETSAAFFGFFSCSAARLMFCIERLGKAESSASATPLAVEGIEGTGGTTVVDHVFVGAEGAAAAGREAAAAGAAAVGAAVAPFGCFSFLGCL